MKKRFSRNALRQLVRRHGHDDRMRISPNADILIYLDLILFIKRLAQEATLAALEENGRARTLAPQHVEQVLQSVLQQFKG
ncbi:hypothetical protein CAOG_009918 [Capsaspora owczarzaki ATCC 30864]|uniref:Centromere protein X n=1 Tax=Capsaspora owczarzaki (strain ATCC 30864) TaxID=595528 RepID=A0A0D2UJU8_CAPO3|nr:hypothetical protein CAOG_009918 [Capsaspora owczarzaki ATCC 30864]